MSLYDSNKNLIAGTGNIAPIEAVIPSDASASNKLVTHQTPYESFTLNNNSGTQKWYKLGTYTSGNNTARLDFVSARVDGQTFESSVRISGVGTNSNYVSWIGEKGCEVSTIDIKVDTNRNLYVKMNSYSAVEIRVYGVFTLNIAEQSSEPSGTQIVLEKLVTESDLNPGTSKTDIDTNIVYYYRSGKVVTVVFNGFMVSSNVAQNERIGSLEFPHAVDTFGVYFTVADYDKNNAITVMRIDSRGYLLASFSASDQTKVVPGRYWGTVTYITG